MNRNFDVRKIVLWLFGIMIVSFLIAGSIMSVKGVGSVFVKSAGKTGNQDINIEKEFNAADIKDMSISTSSTNINVIPVDTNAVKVHYHGYFRGMAGKTAPELEVGLNGSRLVVREKHKVNISIGFNFTNQELKLDLYVPKSYAGSLELGTSSGDVNVDGLSFDRFNFSSSSGNLHAASLNTKNAELNTSSGDFTVKGFSGGLRFNSSSGKLDASDVDLTGNMSVNTSSGDINVDFSKLAGNINSNTSSGEVKLRLPENAEFDVQFDTSSGDFETNFPLTQNIKNRHEVRAKAGNGGSNITAHSSSGDLQIFKR
ncbi:MAG: DUF4097 domain-containing protein [Clostridia bacterium]|nr:DUF4097 domain-containing protein [Clostridia bacterium]